MRASTRKAVLAAHLVFSVGWIGAAGGYLALGISATRGDAETVRAAWIAMEILGWYVIVPVAVLALLSGVVIAVGTRWGLFRHYWVIFSLVGTSVCLGVLVLHMPGVSETAELARAASAADLDHLGGDVLHPAIGLVVLVGVLGLNVFKPRGTTRRGRQVVAGP